MTKREDGKPYEEITEADFRRYPVWEFPNIDEWGETWVVPVKRLPTDHLDFRIAAVDVTLANGKKVFATLSNVKTTSARATEHLVVLEVFQGGKSLQLARYHDFDWQQQESGPEALAKFLGLPIDEVFPIRYDLSALSKAEDPASVVGTIERTPREVLSAVELANLAMMA